MAAAFQIDRFPFFSLSGPPERPFIQLELEARAGADGQSVWDTGERGQPFQLESIVETVNVIVAASLIADYRSLIGGDPVDMIWAGLEVIGVKYVVLDVQPVPRGVHAILFGKGGAGGPAAISFGVCRCVWTLLPKKMV